MLKYVSRRVGVGLLQLLALTIAVFFIIRLLPADPVARLVGMNASPEAYAQAEQQLGLHRPLLTQLGVYLGFDPEIAPGLIQASLGVSWVTGEPVLKEIGTFLPVTLQLVTLAFVFAFVLSVPIGMAGALNPGGGADKGVFVYSLFAGSQPEFWWGLLLIYLCFFQWGIAPAPLGLLSPLTSAPEPITGFLLVDAVLRGRFDVLHEALSHLVLPVICLSFVVSGPIIKMIRQNMMRALQSDFILYGRSIGLPKKRIGRYALRAAMAPSMTIIGILYGFMLSGAVLIESVFSLNGIGQYAIRSVLNFDYPAIQGVVLVIAAVSLVIYLLLDLIQAAIDPRIVY
ncbi:ABC transporter permease [Celeribacter litoreus]|uniref:ABC transporter permease n=1 Tax=Celeribacter litoreus TaxID=2876714 RepID=UPI001CC9FAF5|nr:ABC transporter permease [Celeribacter litoreus]MCA0042521.1 ABC transporter permease [Celeribacter litoreus]